MGSLGKDKRGGESMTKEEAIEDLLRHYTGESTDMAIKALEQDSVLDKIRAEIVDLGQRTMNDNRASGIWACRDIIDKYRVEMENGE